MKLYKLLFCLLLTTFVSCEAYNYETGEVDFNPEEQTDTIWQTKINLAAGKFYKVDAIPLQSFPDLYPVDPWSTGSKLTDEDTGTTTPKDNLVAWANQTVEVVIDLGSLRVIEEVAVHVITDPIYSMKLPSRTTVSVSKNNQDWVDINNGIEFISEKTPDHTWGKVEVDKEECRYVKITMVPAPGGPASIAVDEIKVMGEYKNDPKYVPKEGAYHGAFSPLYGFDQDDREGVTDNNAVVLYEERVQKQLSLLLWYQKMDIGRNWAEMQDVREQYWGKNFESKSRIFIFGWANDDLKTRDIARGSMDEFYKSYFSDVAKEETKEWGPVWFRPLNEMNGSWVGYFLDTKNYVRAWRRMYNIAEQIGITDYNVFVWSPNSVSMPNSPENEMINYYPGDMYVDWLGVSCYPPSLSTIYPEDKRYVNTLMTGIHKISPDKPIMITEGGYSESSDRLRWVQEWFDIKTNFPRVKGIIWENHNDRRIHTEPEPLKLYQELVKDPYWLDHIPSDVLDEMEKRK